ncbi:ferric enterobactin transporter FepG [Azorhizobium oxalatiphilum]|uniref:Ferric enterobactin transporter FepG n=1 Tax=Azorhizobium oxalatiphilum TaxID=980631 RepID=A0A917BKY4_9HYPH|nr:iron chelate uptake ABC transporter family permease subunit [Azorhizobium oxalatiphilum]GGF50172.1 ferric enterobactin transporter FepG [Azorhizobium oxalatiphilum]
MSAARVLRLGPVSLRARPRALTVCGLLVAAGFMLGIVLLGTGTLPFSPGEVMGSLTGTGDNAMADRVILRLRLPRVLTAVFVGAGLGMAGAIFQSVSRNTLGSPDMIGFTTGAATGAITQIVLFDAGPLATALGAVLACIVTGAVVFLLSRKGRTTGGGRLVLVGMGVGAILTGINTVLLVAGHLDQAVSAQIWLAGSLNARTWSHAVPAGLGLLLLAPVALAYARRLDITEMGDDAASQLGVGVERLRLVMVVAAAGLTAIATAATGPIAFIALAAPQLARRLTGAPGVPLLSGAVMGAVLLLTADLISLRFPFSLNLPIGYTTGILGGGYLLWLLTQNRRV